MLARKIYRKPAHARPAHNDRAAMPAKKQKAAEYKFSDARRA
ncbi:hypothetical protein CAMRE0001_1000 [Campylobacter rectus RM3267]|uniref:Uncharacterized protein n=1 Tax=Campylobacter rectus RM3267 TaxID=553218 RepID=B9D2Q6_CAMRE|nr:hypothetical protein CAMRE0001_1000 [Campylobacter rectus RM3267]